MTSDIGIPPEPAEKAGEQGALPLERALKAGAMEAFDARWRYFGNHLSRVSEWEIGQYRAWFLDGWAHALASEAPAEAPTEPMTVEFVKAYPRTAAGIINNLAHRIDALEAGAEAGSAPLLTPAQAQKMGMQQCPVCDYGLSCANCGCISEAGSAPLVLPAKMYEDPNAPVKCRQCGRKSWSHSEGSPCDFPQPDGGLCVGLFSRIYATPLSPKQESR